MKVVTVYYVNGANTVFRNVTNTVTEKTLVQITHSDGEIATVVVSNVLYFKSKDQ